MTRGSALARIAILALLLLATALVAHHVGLPSRQELQRTFADLAWWVPIAYAGLYAVITMAPLPKTVFSLAAGAIFGVPLGLVTVLVGAVIGASAAFWVARRLGGDSLRRLLGHRAEHLDEALATHGFWAVLVARLVPVVPFTALNYAAGLSSIRYLPYALATAIGMIPGTSAAITIGAYGGDLGAWPVWAALGTLALLALAGGLLTVVRRRRQRPRLR